MNAPTIRFKEFYNEMFGEVTLNDLVEVVDCQHNTAPITDSDTEYKMIRTSNVRNGRLIVNTMDSVEESIYEQWSSRGYLEPNDIILTREAPMGEVAIIPADKKEKFFLGQRCLQLKSKQSIISPGYMFFLLQSSTFNNHIRPLKSSGSTVSNIRIPELKKFNFLVPSKLEQNKVTAFLFELIKRIELQQEKVELLKQQKKGLMQKIFSQELRFKDENGQGYPEWSTYMLEDIFEVIDGDRGKNYPNENHFNPVGHTIFLDTKNVTKKGFNFFNKKYISKEKCDSMSNGLLNRGDIVITSRGSIGNIALYNNEIPYDYLRINSAMLILRAKSSKINLDFWYQLLKSKVISDFVRTSSVGSAQPHITKKDFNRIKVFIPTSVKEQYKISNILYIQEKLLEIQELKLEKLILQKKGFLQRMFI